MKESLRINPEIVARRCAVKSLDYRQLTPLDWIVLDFADGLKSFREIAQLIPAKSEDVATAYYHLRLLGLLTWQSSANSQISMEQDQSHADVPRSSVNPAIGRSGIQQSISRAGTSQNLVGISQRAYSSGQQRSVMPGLSPMSPSGKSNSGSIRDSSLRLRSASVSLAPTVSNYSDEICAQYLPPRLFTTFRRFQPTLLNEALDIPAETQVFIEFIHENLSTMSPCDLLGLPEGTTDKAAIRQAYLNRTKQFHPDRYFRKNIGAFAPRIAAIFKAVSNAFAALQAQ